MQLSKLKSILQSIIKENNNKTSSRCFCASEFYEIYQILICAETSEDARRRLYLGNCQVRSSSQITYYMLSAA